MQNTKNMRNQAGLQYTLAKYRHRKRPMIHRCDTSNFDLDILSLTSLVPFNPTENIVNKNRSGVIFILVFYLGHPVYNLNRLYFLSDSNFTRKMDVQIKIPSMFFPDFSWQFLHAIPVILHSLCLDNDNLLWFNGRQTWASQNLVFWENLH